eukprot:13122031-Alexandrium_andersonii.AAC.1
MLTGLMGRGDTELGWSARGSVKLNVAANAAGLRAPEPRLEPAEFPWRTSLAGHRLAIGTPLVWRVIDCDVDYATLGKKRAPLLPRPEKLITAFLQAGVHLALRSTDVGALMSRLPPEP